MWFWLCIIGFLAINGVTSGDTRPEVALLRALTEPLEFTSDKTSDCSRDGTIYVSDLRNYRPWALLSK